MLQKSLKLFIAAVLIVSHVSLVCGDGYAAAPTVRLIINPNKTDVYAGSDPIALTAKASGAGLQYNWELQGPGKIDGTGSAVFYNIPATIPGSSAQAILTVVVTDETGQETTETVTFNILSSKAPATQPAAPKARPKKGMSTGTKIALGVGAAALLGGGLALALSGGDDDKCGGADVGGACWYLGNLGESCSTVCASHGGYNEATLTYAGSGGTNANCDGVLNAVGAPADQYGDGTDNRSSYCGCLVRMGTFGWDRQRGVYTTNATCYSSSYRRACACNE